MAMAINLYADSAIPKNVTGLPNLSDRPKAQDGTVDIFADFLYWYASETLDWGYVLNVDGCVTTDSFKTISFKPAPGFRVGLGYNMHHDQWDTQFSYTRFHTKGRGQTNGPIFPGFLAVRLTELEPFATGKIRHNLHYNILDWDLGRSFYVSNYLSLRPLIGLKGGWINQKICARWTTPNFILPGFLFYANEHLQNNFWGIGPKGGVNGKWILGKVNQHAFSLIGNFEGAFMWGHWKLQDECIDVFLTQTSIPMRSRKFGALMVQALLGFGWDLDFNKERSHFAFKAGYEIQDWFSQFQVFTNDSGTDNLDLILQGLNLEMRFDF